MFQSFRFRFRTIFIFFAATLALCALAAIVCLFFLDDSAAGATVLGSVLLAFALLGGGLLLALGRAAERSQAALSGFTAHMLAEEYGQADGRALVDAAPGLGDQVAELAAQYKERLGFSRSILSGLPIPCCIVDRDQHITFLNRECLDMLGSKESPETYHGRMISQIFYKDDRRSKIADCMEHDTRAMNVEAVFKHADGSDIDVLISLFPLHDVEGRIIGGCCLYMNTTQLKRHEREIVDQNRRISTAAEQATAISDELAQAAAILKDVVAKARLGSEVQSGRTAETATAMAQMNATVSEVARYAVEAARDAEDASERAITGETVVRQVITAIEEVSGHAAGLKLSMEQLDERAEQVGVVLGVIEDIADQTNLLALNAAIEAARAGEAGRGFAVVADEVRKLAEKTMHATSEVHSVVRGIQEVARQNVLATQTAVGSVNRSTELAGHSGEALGNILSITRDTAEQVRSIATAAEEQSAASEQINAATADVTRLCEETESLMEDAARAIARVESLAASLAETMDAMH
ncbi:methyl-accepting chemotaxis protein [Pseudodesulfovibrio indicus]|uniref:Chemotaxis protein n=1 Tax=Pseudodesulfovibrio indicus TaxID=1716143 RepID=A0A126QNL2_9BACT|nr:methyl-accepting chemotaxis protein [Pseudodesulfovibrio indicus]AMK11268.1 chemotaxis protein [Pseudodesulfovibrio indicus]TDT85585.1 methyl-accepting chemotaxis protein [Pseudodesulfovibrio indicus]